jgi:hypothetical protein
MFLYADGLIQWTTGDASGGTDGLGGTEALAGFNAGDGVHSATVPNSLTPGIINISQTSNVERDGLWIFRVDLGSASGPDPGPDLGFDPGFDSELDPESG